MVIATIVIVPAVPFGAAAAASASRADSAAWRSLDPDPIAMRGGIVLLPMEAPTPAPNAWPETIPVRCVPEDRSADITVVEGVLG
ncbi:MAG: hypothetical protein RJA16_682, partial [Planctomycetota bacterium]